eukprot:5709981-Alexandrium_andersonii.AAC.1
MSGTPLEQRGTAKGPKHNPPNLIGPGKRRFGRASVLVTRHQRNPQPLTFKVACRRKAAGEQSL